jgi:hypothetical protein
MVKVRIKNDEVYYDGYLAENLTHLKDMVRMKWDGLGYICGYEGDGKSTLADQVAYFLDHSYCLDRCVFTPEQFIKAVNDAKPFQAIVFDEAHQAFSTANRFDKVNRIILSKLTMIRKKQLFMIIVAPTFFNIQKYLVIHRSRFMIHVYAEAKVRGNFRFFNRETKHKLYIKGKGYDNMYAEQPNFIGRFTKFFHLDEEAYEAKKDEASLVWEKKQSQRKEIVSQRLLTLVQDKLLIWLTEKHLLKQGGLKMLAEEYYMLAHGTMMNRLSKARLKSVDLREDEED